MVMSVNPRLNSQWYTFLSPYSLTKNLRRSGSILSKEENTLLQVLLQLEAILCLKVYVTLLFPQTRCLKLEVLTNPSVQGKQEKASWRWFLQ